MNEGLLNAGFDVASFPAVAVVECLNISELLGCPNMSESSWNMNLGVESVEVVNVVDVFIGMKGLVSEEADGWVMKMEEGVGEQDGEVGVIKSGEEEVDWVDWLMNKGGIVAWVMQCEWLVWVLSGDGWVGWVMSDNGWVGLVMSGGGWVDWVMIGDGWVRSDAWVRKDVVELEPRVIVTPKINDII